MTLVDKAFPRPAGRLNSEHIPLYIGPSETLRKTVNGVRKHVKNHYETISVFFTQVKNVSPEVKRVKFTQIFRIYDIIMGGGWFPKLVWPKHNMINQQVKVGVANNDKRAKC